MLLLVTLTIIFLSKIMNGKLIFVEGVDGSGKTTATKLLVNKLTDAGKKVHVVNILKDDPVSLQLRTIVTNPDNEIGPVAEICIYVAAVVNAFNQVVKPLLEQKDVFVICDRSHLSTLAYQVIPQKLLGNNKPERIWKAAFSGVSADLLLVLYVDPETGLKRVVQRDGVLDRLEMRGKEYLEIVQQSFQDYCESVDNTSPTYTYENNGTRADLERAVESALKLL